MTIRSNLPAFHAALQQLGFITKYPYPEGGDNWVARGQHHGETLLVLIGEESVHVSNHGGNDYVVAFFTPGNAIEAVVSYILFRLNARTLPPFPVNRKTVHIIFPTCEVCGQKHKPDGPCLPKNPFDLKWKDDPAMLNESGLMVCNKCGGIHKDDNSDCPFYTKVERCYDCGGIHPQGPCP